MAQIQLPQELMQCTFFPHDLRPRRINQPAFNTAFNSRLTTLLCLLVWNSPALTGRTDSHVYTYKYQLNTVRRNSLSEPRVDEAALLWDFLATLGGISKRSYYIYHFN